ncbi:MAG: 30S ribosomal protein S8 [Candidatus Taylorbacteria bacterium RIFCSPLOWO2_02_FULL_43_11]|uniref:Small ribosomal subunit protein uS8 n=1 Tax=Candidatus Taylorbacteria bacterium RIFCSPHIGHO2_02_FULL_43_32b TaxID=1802306 RepID=A0A1G2MHV4_9BACT|nr:MAG: 30S ribosomal protein S8 [Candidatus Taylorbacteria bacterium RIFCSPHIGHO2_01_FULL_43_47]OHA23304.1 MAG: 30S ribosomal protein S8 [Candidatus Taylorbacteria bacterium RIFCSPHIGHO2_02_FULL_43_32b]OHA30172.1 MAG: 30S ribosomal protein S8 [Candidatus Taylorbacteria bacterium RIFCSPLOWO2_01_FULL_43_44]OHA36019.1 MAG: 30S ribosomal protein S8 [Candidatus Taylorbacteria bacterium RIFCSPLOWO2_02_FULL_43_11]
MDYISDMLIRIKNANSAYKPEVSIPYSSLGMSVAQTLAKSGFTGSPLRKGKRLKFIELPLIYENDEPKISGIKRLSGQAKRMYTGVSSIRPVRNGYGKLVVSTSSGVMTGEEAKKAKIGGELLFEIW